MDIIVVEKEKDFESPCEGLVGKIKRAIVHHKGSFYLVSENTAMGETLIFNSSPTGEVKSWHEVGGGRGVSLREVLENFEKELHGYF